MKFTCPCNKQVEAKVLNGIIMYVHEDGRSCEELNGLHEGRCEEYGWRKCKDALKKRDANQLNIYMSSQAKFYYRSFMSYVNEFCYKDVMGLVDLLIFLFDEDSEVDSFISKELCSYICMFYGETAKKNILATRKGNKSITTLMLACDVGISRNKARSYLKMPNVEKLIAKKQRTGLDNILKDLERSLQYDTRAKSKRLKNTIGGLARKMR